MSVIHLVLRKKESTRLLTDKRKAEQNTAKTFCFVHLSFKRLSIIEPAKFRIVVRLQNPEMINYIPYKIYRETWF